MGRIGAVLCVAAIASAAVMSVAAQTPPAKPTFEVASIKPVNPSAGSIVSLGGGCRGIDSKFWPDDELASVPLGRCVISGARIDHLVMYAYEVDAINMIGAAPGLEKLVKAGGRRFDVDAKAEAPSTTTEQQLREMLQNLLAERFKMTLHRDRRGVQGYALVVKSSPRLRDAGSDEAHKVTIDGSGDFARAYKAKDLNSGTGSITLTCQKTSISELMEILVSRLKIVQGGHVIDKSGLTGFYDFKMTWELGEPISNVLQSQLGLSLVSQKVPAEYFVIDSAQYPTED